MKWSDLLQSSLSALRQRFFRTAMTVLGVIIGTMSVVVMVSLGVGMSQSLVDDSADDASLTRVTVTGGENTSEDGRKVTKVMNKSTIQSLSRIAGVNAVVPVYQVSLKATAGGKSGSLTVVGIPADAMESQGFKLAQGQIPTRGDGFALVMGSKVDWEFGVSAAQKEQGERGHMDWMHEQVFVDLGIQGSSDSPTGGGGAAGGSSTTTGDGGSTTDGTTGGSSGGTTGGSSGGTTGGSGGGAMGGTSGGGGSTTGGGTTGGFASSAPRKVVAPVSGVLAGNPNTYSSDDFSTFVDLDRLIDAMRKANPSQALPGQPATADGRPRGTDFVYSQVYLNAESPQRAEELTSELRQEGYSTTSNIELIKQMQQTAGIVQAVFGAIGFISLLVAAIGIANTMMMSVYERTKQIGVMKVLGASLRDIRRMFLVESAFIGFFGGFTGLILSWLISLVMNAALAGLTSVAGSDPKPISIIPVWLALASVIFATLIGTLAGVMPAQRAMKLSPLAAIRSE